MVLKTQYRRLSDLSGEQLEQLSQRTYYFAHQSVGNNIADGLAVILKDNPAVKLEIQVGSDPNQLQPGVFMHSEVGKNTQPETKIFDFEKVLEGGVGNKVNAAFLKFCYIDVSRNKPASAEETFATYRNRMEVLKKKYPQTTFVHFSMPIHSVPSGLRVEIKKLMDREIPEYGDNIMRGRFNELLRAEYGGKEPLFDIARLESIAIARGKQYVASYRGKTFEVMAPDNTYDGGHLTDAGKRWVAEQLLVFLATLEYKS